MVRSGARKVYGLDKNSSVVKIRKKLVNLGLSCTGNRDDLLARLRNYESKFSCSKHLDEYYVTQIQIESQISF